MSTQDNDRNGVASPPEVRSPSTGANGSKMLLRRRPETGSQRRLRSQALPSAGAASPSSPGLFNGGPSNGKPSNGGSPNGSSARGGAGGIAPRPERILSPVTAANGTNGAHADTKPRLLLLPEAPKPSFLSTVKGKVICASAVGGLLLAAIGVLLWMKSNEIDPQQVKEELKEEIARVNRLPAEKLLEKDEMLHSILENPLYAQYGAEIRKGVARSHEVLHQSADDLRKARDRVKPFLARYQSLKSRPDRLKSEAQKYYDEGRALNDQFGSTLYGTKLAEVVKELEAVLESNPEEGERTAGIPGAPGGSAARG